MSARRTLEPRYAPGPVDSDRGEQRRKHATTLRSLAAALALGFFGCLLREEMGVEPSPLDAGCGAECADAGVSDADTLHERLRRLLAELARGPWVGQMESGELRVPVTFEFGADGTYTVRCRVDACQVFFPSIARGVVRGRYEISAEVLHGAFFGAFEDPLASLTLRSELYFLTLHGDRLTFERRLLTRSLLDTEFVALLARADLTRSP